VQKGIPVKEIRGERRELLPGMLANGAYVPAGKTSGTEKGNLEEGFRHAG